MVWLCKTKIWWKCKNYRDTDSFVVHVEADDIFKDIAENVEKWFETSNSEIDRPLPKGKN